MRRPDAADPIEFRGFHVSQSLAGKLAIVSGSSKGLGAAIALELASM